MRRADVRALFRVQRAAFERALGADIGPHELPRLAIVKRACSMPGHCAERDLAYATRGRRPRVVLLERALRLSANNVAGLLLHELGHIYDPRPRARGAEQRADDVAEWITGQRISYDARDIQTVGRGTHPRPARLHR